MLTQKDSPVESGAFMCIFNPPCSIVYVTRETFTQAGIIHFLVQDTPGDNIFLVAFKTVAVQLESLGISQDCMLYFHFKKKTPVPPIPFCVATEKYSHYGFMHTQE